MEKILKLFTVKRQYSNGFTMIELLIVLSFVIFVTTMVSHHQIFKELPYANKGIITLQVEAMYKLRRKYVTADVWFNANGNVNHARDFDYNNKKCTIQLGFGRYRCV
ncbi:prepilin-type N-terminal cleavage/methylation domain-containing protein [Erysipelothrix anatis]|uniref:prepilin-type N-terminal cleavage/methylation domain-containing protein n=1 Tax=Erysipelothrix anatis TaxID=2683713 RepID=UPI0013580F14|nr:type II secretion system protein [Erysipelothrix anatis]